MTDPAVRHDAQTCRFELPVEGHRCELDYTLIDGVMWITHTGVPAALQGRGLAARLTEAALAHARAAGWRVNPRCSYAAAYFRRHPEVGDLLAV